MKLPTRSRGRRSAEQEAKLQRELKQFAEQTLEIRSRLDFSPGSRGWCYILEDEAGLSKGNFNQAEDLVVLCRKRGLLPLDIVAVDEKRRFQNVQDVFDGTPEEYAEALLLGAHEGAACYYSRHFWENQPYYCQMVVEKIDLRELFKPVCAEFYLPIANGGGWSNLHVRAEMMTRFRYWEKRGKQLVLLYCGDFDPGGMLISNKLMDNMREIEAVVGWDPSGVIIKRFGLNLKFIKESGLSWIENLVTSSGKDLANPRHRDHRKEYVQRWLRDIGTRKVEANALVTRPKAGRRLCYEAITEYVAPDAPHVYKEEVEFRQEEVRLELDRLVPEAPWKGE